MPLYEYRCEKCGGQFEVMQKFADTPLTTHEECGGHVERLISAPALQFKGSGWYVNDYPKGGGEKPADNGAPKKPDASAPAPSTGSESGSGSSASSPSRPETTTSSSSEKK